MRSFLSTCLPVSILVVLSAFQGCGVRPVTDVPKDITIPQILDVIEKNSVQVQDFSCRAEVNVRIDGSPEDVTAYIRYKQPDRYRIYIKGLFGTDIARIKALEDSLIFYVPSENIYITSSRDTNILGILMPEVDIDLKSIESIFNGTLPSSEQQEEYKISLQHLGQQIELLLKRGNTQYRYILKGRDLRLVSEEMLINDMTVWRKTVSAYGSSGGIAYPREMKIERGGDTVHIAFSNCSVNSGLTEKDLSFSLPSSAERYVIE